MGKTEFVTVNVQIGNNTRTVKMEKGTQFQNKGGIFTADKNGATVKMTNYQMKVFEAVANNVKEQGMGDGVVLSAEDIKSAQQKFKQGGFVADMSEFLPDGYKIERPKMSTNDKYIEAYVTNGKESQSATLRFTYGVTANNTATNTNPTQNNTWKTPTSVSAKHKERMSKDGTTFDVNRFLEMDDDCFGENSDMYFETFRNAIAQYQGKHITPNLIDNVISSLMNYKNKYYYDYPIADAAINTIISLQDYLSPQTLDKFLNNIKAIRSIDDYGASSIDVSDAKKMYDKLSSKQRVVYYQKLLNSEAVTGNWLMGDTASSSFVDYIFEKPVSQSTLNQLKVLFTDINESGNGIKLSKSATKNAVNTLLQRGQITQQQASELLKAGNMQ